MLIVFGVIALAAIMWPLLNRSNERPWGENERASFAEREAAALAELRDLEFDQRLGKLAAEDYRELRTQLARRAVAALKAVEAAHETKGARELDELIEQEIANLRRAWRQPVADSSLPNGLPPAIQPAGTGKRQSACPACGQAVEPDDRFCVACGAALPLACPNCAAVLPANARFCPQCGCEVPEQVAETSPRLVELLRYDPELAALFPCEASSTAAPKTASTRSASRSSGSKWLLAAGVVAAVWAGVVGIFYFRARTAIESQQPITTLAAADYHAMVILPADPNFAFLGHGGGLMWSSDGGINWQPASVSGEVLALAVHPADPLRVYATGSDLFLRSDDGGRNWAEVATDLPGRDIQALAVAPDDPETLYAFIAGQGLWRSENGGMNWRPVDTTLSENVTTLALTPRTIYVGTDGAGILRSDDGGATWASGNGIVNGALDSPRVRALAYDPTTEMLYAGTDRGLSFTTSTGSGWTRRPFSSDVAALALGPDGTTMLLVTSGGEVYRSRDRGVTWGGE
ncbi:MAG: zinc ribbon domain-containing protein [Chloroflexi bacterium]|nr:zinc ribbon domain-containing protein [Chloroflexota bacterium]